MSFQKGPERLIYEIIRYRDNDFEHAISILGSSIRSAVMCDEWVEDPLFGISAIKDLSKNFAIESGRPLKMPFHDKPCYCENTLFCAESAVVHAGCHIFGCVLIGPGVVLGPNAVVFGPTIIGPNGYVGPFVEIRRSLIGSELMLSHSSYVGHSLIAANVNIGAYFVSAVRNMKRKTVNVKHNNQLIDTKEELFGAMIGSGTEFGVRVTLMPGRRIGRRKVVDACEKIVNNIL